jgi:hypothetical protein
MGFRKEATHYKLNFEEYDGFNVTAKSLPLKDFLEINRLSTSEEKATEQQELLFRKFADALVDWNLEDEKGKPVPATYAGLISQEPQFVGEIIQAWMRAIASVPKTSKNDSNGTGTYPEESIPMALL